MKKRNDNGKFINQVLVDVSGAFHVRRSQITDGTRKRPAARARHVAMLLIWRNSKMTLGGLGKVFGGRVPASVSWAIQHIYTQMHEDAELKAKVQCLQKQLGKGVIA